MLAGGNSRATLYTTPYPRYAVSGSGAWVTDADGNRLLDFHNNYTSLIHGHAYAPVVDAVRHQVGLGTSFGLPTEAEIELAELLHSRVARFERIRFTNSGTEAVMQAVKAARAYTGRPAIAKCEGSYHGTYDFAEVSLDSGPENWGEVLAPSSVPYSDGTPRSVLAEVVVLPFNAVEAARELLLRERHRLAAVLVDALPNRVGLAVARPEYLTMLRQVTSEIGALLILDEVITFRLGWGGIQGLDGLSPDLTTLGKIIGGGLPVGALAGSADVMEVFSADQGPPAVPHSGTFNANPLTMAAGLAAMKGFGKADLDRLDVMGVRVRTELEGSLEEAGIPGEVRGRGSLFKIHLGAGTVVDYRSMRSHRLGAVRELSRQLQEQGVLVSQDGLGCLSTAMSDSDIEWLVRAFRTALPVAMSRAV